MTDDRRSRPLLKTIQRKENEHSHQRIGEGRAEFVRPTPLQVQSNHPASHHEIDDLVDHVENQGYEQPSARVLDVKPDAQGGGQVSDERLGNAVDTDRQPRERILKQSDGSPGQQAGNRIAPRDREEDRDQQRQIKHREKRKLPRQPRLQKESRDWNDHRYRDTEPVNLNLLARCVSNGHVIAADPAEEVAGIDRAPALRASA